MDELTLREVAQAVAGRWRETGASAASPPPGSLRVRRVATDSRKLRAGDLFVPLRGERFDGHDFLADAAAVASAALVERGRAPDAIARPDGRGGFLPLVEVEDTTVALGALASWYRDQLRARVVGITGSAGKTTVKDFLGQILGRAASTVEAERSFNNHIGVPLTILRADRETRHLVLEIGTSAPGEIAALGSIARPDLALLTSIAPAHLEGLGTLDGVVRAKAEIFESLDEGSQAFLPAPIYGEDRFLAEIRKRSAQLVRFGWARNDLLRDGYWVTGCRARTSSRSLGAAPSPGFQFEVNGSQRFEMPLAGRHNVTNALAAIAVARELGVDWQTIREGVAALRLPPLRLAVERVGGVTVVDDSYNANPASLRAAVQSLGDIGIAPSGRWFLVFGDFLELGDASPTFHEKVGEDLARTRRFETIFTVGDEAGRTARSAARLGAAVEAFDAGRLENVADAVAERLRPGDGVLFKGSRRMQLDRAARHLRERLQKTHALSGESRSPATRSSHVLLNL